MDKQRADFQARLNALASLVLCEANTEDVAVWCGVSKSAVYKWRANINSLPVHQCIPIYRATGDLRILQALLPEDVLPVPLHANINASGVHALLGQSAHKDSGALETTLQALADGRITQHEAGQIIRELRKAVEAKLELLEAVNQLAPDQDCQGKLKLIAGGRQCRAFGESSFCRTSGIWPCS